MLNELISERNTTSAGESPADERTIQYEEQVQVRTALPALDWPGDLFSREFVNGPGKRLQLR